MADGVYSRRFQTIAQMARDAAAEVTRSGEVWKRFLNTAGKVYRYPFMDQLLIHKQRPDGLVTGYLYKNVKNLNKSVKVRSYMFKYAKTASRKFETPPA